MAGCGSMAARAEPRRTRGFSLVETLVALAVFAVLVVALLNLAGQSTRTVLHVEEAVYAGLVADTIAAEARLADAVQLARPAQGLESLGGRDWPWRRSAQPTGGGGLLHVRIDVMRPDGDGVAASVSVFR